MKAIKSLLLIAATMWSTFAFPQGGTLQAPRAWSTENQVDKSKSKAPEYQSARPPIPYTHVREADLFWAKRTWQVIDLRQKINQPFMYPIKPARDRISFNEIILNIGFGKGDKIQLYNDEDFQNPIDVNQAKRSVSKEKVVYVRDSTGAVTDTIISQETIEPQDIEQYWIVEDWFFDKQRSVLDVRIIAIAPIFYDYYYDGNGDKQYKLGANGEKQPSTPFWIYFPDLRPTLARNYAYNLQNTAGRMSWDDVFFKRLFGSYFRKEENVFDRSIQEYATGMDALFESERIKESIRNYEHDLWEY